MKRDLPPQQQAVYDVIVEYHRQNGFAPTYGDIATCLGLAESTVITYVKILKLKGCVTSREKTPRSLRVIEQSV
jgi:SOS-response transcriptional repressor LexA